MCIDTNTMEKHTKVTRLSLHFLEETNLTLLSQGVSRFSCQFSCYSLHGASGRLSVKDGRLSVKDGGWRKSKCMKCCKHQDMCVCELGSSC